MLRVLVVEDSQTVRELLVTLLEQDPDIRVVGQAANGAEAVEMTAELEPDVITMDVVMPDMDGLEATRRIMGERPTPIIFVTAHADSPEFVVVFEAMKAGALEVLGKPANFDGGWGLVRASNTQPVLVLRFEAKTSERLSEIQSIVMDKLEEIQKTL